jgi:putative lipase involved disintegration of autophagic bodies
MHWKRSCLNKLLDFNRVAFVQSFQMHLRLYFLFLNLVTANTSRFKLLKTYKALPGKDEKVAVFEATQIHSLQQEWSGPLKYETIPKKQTILNIQNSIQSVLKIPDSTDHDTVVNLAKLILNAYYETKDPAWVKVPGWDVAAKFGWNNGGIRGYLFESESKEDLIIVIKGTSLATPVSNEPTGKLDKLNDNMMFSCCCANGWGWNATCDCIRNGNECSQSCVLQSSSFDDSYYNLAQVYLNLI